MAYENYYGVQKTPEPRVRNNKDMAMGIGSSAATGASLGASAGPYGAIIGGAVGAGVGAVSQFTGRGAERRQFADAQSYNQFAQRMQQLGGSEYEYTGIQAKQGFNARYQTQAEVESINGVGEVVIDKNKNVKYISTGNKPHSEGGDPLPFTLKKGDSIIPTQGDAKAQEKILTLLKRVKLRGDKVAEKQIDDIVDKLPTNEDYASQGKQEGEYPDGLAPYGITKPRQAIQFDVARDVMPANMPILDSYPQRNLKSSYEQTSDFNNVAFKSADDYSQRNQGNNLQSRYTSAELPQSTGINTQPVQGLGTRTLPSEALAQDSPDAIVDPNLIKTRINPTKYLSAINNLYQSAQAPELTERRFYNPEDMQYKDMSAAQRAAITEQRNTNMGNLRGRGLSAGQTQSYASQIGAQAVRQNAQVNDREAQRYDSVNNANIQGRNQATAMNTQMASRYDAIDAQNRAAKQKYGDQGILDVANFRQVDEQKRYKMDKDKRAFDIQEETLGFIGTGNYDVERDENGRLKKVYVKSTNTDLTQIPGYEYKDGKHLIYGVEFTTDKK